MKGKIEIVQLLRGVAALLVCFFHMKGILDFQGYKIGTFLFGNGSIGVPLFFMISGFIMVVTTYNSKPTFSYLSSFYLKRIVRIVPLYYLITFLVIVLLGNSQFYFIDNPNLLLSGLLFAPSLVSKIGPSYGMPPLEVGWSLNFEMFFYAILGLSFFFKRAKWILLVFVMLALVYLVPVLTVGFISDSLSSYYGYTAPYLNLVTNPIILFFVFGVLVGLLYKSNFRVGGIFTANSIVVLSSANFLLTYFGVYAIGLGYYGSMVSCGLLLFSLLNREKVLSLSVPKPFVFLGDISYSLYLVHPLVLLLLPKILRSVGLNLLLIEPWYMFFCLPIILFFSYLSYAWIEVRLSSWINSKILYLKKDVKAARKQEGIGV
jgi:peptidoglycan/LPS O-acetylase OafA/YrhL